MIDRAQFLEWCAGLFNEPVDRLTMETSRDDIEGWDSMGSLLLLADLDEQYGIQVGEEGLGALNSLADIESLILSHVKPE